MIVKNVSIMVTNKEMKSIKDTNDEYCALGILTLDDGEKFNVISREHEIYDQLTPLQTAVVDMGITTNKFGIKISITKIKSVAKGLAE